MIKMLIAVVSLLVALGVCWLLFAQGRHTPPAEEKSNVESPDTVAVVPKALVETIASPKFAEDLPKPEISPAELLARKYYDPKSDAATRMRAYVELTFGDVLASFGLRGETLQKIVDLIAVRYLSATDAQELIDRSHRENGGVTTGGEWDKLRQKIEASIDAEIRQIVDPQTASNIARMLKASMFFTQVKAQYAKQFAAIGAPLTPIQVFSLASALSETFGPDAPDTRMSKDMPVDPDTGLTDRDKAAIGKASSALTAAQLEVFRQALAASTARVSAKR